jgi:hypothetical protein
MMKWDIGLEVIGGTPEEFARSIQRQRENYGRLVRPRFPAFRPSIVGDADCAHEVAPAI